MAVYLKKFENHTQYENYINGSGAILPNVSICITEGDVHYNPSTPPTPVETRVVAKFNVDNTSNPTQIISQYTEDSPFSAIEIDGVVQPSVVTGYTFSTTGEHTVKYTLTDPTTIGNQVFSNCFSLTSITIPNSVTSIGYGAFSTCIGLTSIVIPNSVTSINDNTFYGCENLTSINIPSSVTSIGETAFRECSSLTSINIPSSVTSIGWSAFGCCYNLNEDAVSAIEAINPNDAFYCD